MQSGGASRWRICYQQGYFVQFPYQASESVEGLLSSNS